jgi:TonB family protein
MFLISLAALVQAGAAAIPVPRGPLQSTISANDYPQGLAASAARSVAVTLVVGPDGRVANCTIVTSSGTPVLDATTCRLLRSRSRFTPASDASGSPTAGEVSATIDWAVIRSGKPRAALANAANNGASPPPLITVPIAPAAPETGSAGARARTNLAALISSDDYPAEAFRAGEQGTTSFRLSVGADGAVTNCSVTQSSGSTTLDTATCQLMTSRARFTPAVDAGGRPVGDTVNARIAWRLPPRSVTVPDLLLTRFAVRADGTAHDCVRLIESIGRTQEAKAPDCGPRQPPSAVLATLRNIGGKGEIRVRMEARLIRDAAKPWPVLEQPGLKIVAFHLVRLRVAPGGRVLGCVVLDQQLGGLPPANLCRGNLQVQGYTAPGEAEMRIVAFTALETAG